MHIGPSQFSKIHEVTLFISAIDDTNMSGIRRSIFIYASFIFFTLCYQLSITPQELTGGFISASGDIQISTTMIVAFCSITQAYLLFRLWMAHPIALAKLNRAWGTEELETSDDFLSSVSKLKEIVKRSSEVKYPDVMLSEVAPEALAEFKKLEEAYDEAVRTYGILSEKSDIIYEEYERARTQLTEITSPYTNATTTPKRYPPEPELREICLRLERNMSALGQTIRTLGDTNRDEVRSLSALDRDMQVLKNTNKSFKGFKALKQYCEEFPSVFDALQLDDLLSNLKNSLADTRRQRKREFWIFEFGIPACVGGLSILFAIGCSAAEWINAISGSPEPQGILTTTTPIDIHRGKS